MPIICIIFAYFIFLPAYPYSSDISSSLSSAEFPSFVSSRFIRLLFHILRFRTDGYNVQYGVLHSLFFILAYSYPDFRTSYICMCFACFFTYCVVPYVDIRSGDGDGVGISLLKMCPTVLYEYAPDRWSESPVG